MRKIILAACLAALPVAAHAADDVKISPETMKAAVAAAWPKLAPDMQARVDQDETMAICSATHNSPQSDVGEEISKTAKASIKYPEDGKFLGNWEKGKELANSGYGGRMKDDPAKANGGNCYACHQLDPKEVAYGTLGPSLKAYGKERNFGADDAKAVYEKIYNPHAALPCTTMPRFGANGFLSIEQIKDIVAFVMSPESPVNK